MKVDCGKRDIECVSRVGKKSEKVGPIIVTFTAMGKKRDYSKTRKCCESPVISKLEKIFSRIFLKEERSLVPHLRVQQKREQGKGAFIRYNKLIILLGKVNTNHERQKSNLSQSPKAVTVVERKHEFISKNRSKKDKIDLNFVKRKPENTHTKSLSQQKAKYT